MEQRKLIRLGNSSFAISLPKEWVDKSGLKKGDNIFIEKNSNGEIIISPEQRRSIFEKKKIINIEGKNEKELRRMLIDAYINGYTELNLHGNINNDQIKLIKNTTNNLLSYEIIKQTKNDVVIKDFFNFEDLNLNNFIRRIDTNLREMFELLEKGFRNKFDFKIINEVKEIDYDVNKLYFFFSRIMTNGINNPSIVSSIHTEPVFLFNYWWVAFHMESIGDNIKSIVKLMHKSENKQIVQISPLLSKLKNFYLNSLESFYLKDKEKADKLTEEGQTFFNEAENLIYKSDPLKTLILERLNNIENNIYQIIKMIIYLKEE